MELTVGVITASDKGSQGLREDESGRVIISILEEIGAVIKGYQVVPDDIGSLTSAMRDMSDRLRCHLIFTTGGTGFSKRDMTPEATMMVAERHAPGIAEAMRQKSLLITDRAMLSRGVSVIRGESIIINLPGSPRAVRECLECILPALPHGVEILIGEAVECARP